MTFSSRLRSTNYVFSIVNEIIFFSLDLSSIAFALYWEAFLTLEYFHSAIAKENNKWKLLTVFSSELVFNILLNVLECTTEGLV